ncbi:META domain-containing protein [Nocardia sp. NPDC058666]|uniref:META domain-containing protein n=1 Tax=Nocardia sp. NPDC058666 TaxID=3346587 RepID=UPI00365C44BA
MRITVRRLAALAVLTAAVAGCGSAEKEPADEAATPMGHTYISTEVEGGSIPGGGPLTLTFADGRISANSGCNTSSGTVDLSDRILRTSALASTLMGCPGEGAKADGWQNTFLESAPGWRLDGGKLTLTGAGTTVYLTDKKIASPDKPLIGTTWAAGTMLTPDAQVRSTALDEAAPTLLISDGGAVSGNAGCNRMTGTAAVDGATVTFAVATTRMMCPPDVMDVEQHVLRALDGKTTATIDADTLTLRNDNGFGLILHAQQ